MESQLHRTHGSDYDDPLHPAGEHKDDTQIVNDSPVVRSGLAQPTVMGTPVLAEDLYGTHSDIVDTPVRSFAQWEEEERHGAPPPLSTAYETHLTDIPHGGHHTYGGDVDREQFKASIGKHTFLEEEIDDSPLPPSTGTDRSMVGHHAYGDEALNREERDYTNVTVSSANPHATDSGGKEVGITEVLHSLDKMKVFNEHESKSSESDQSVLEPKVNTGSQDQFAPEPVENSPLDTISVDPSNPNSSYAQRISSAASAVADRAVAVKDSVVSKLSSSVENKGDTGSVSHKTNLKSSFPTTFSHKVADTLSSTLGPVYEKVTEAGSSVASKMHGSGHGDENRETKMEGKGATMKEYLVDTFKPGDDDKVLSEVITHAFHRGKGDQQKQETSTTTYAVIRDEGERRLQDSGN